jgi:hypothetical protein
MLFDVHVVMHILLATQQVKTHIKENIFPQFFLLKVMTGQEKGDLLIQVTV